MLTFFFAYLAGLLTLINPCIVPILPIVLASSLQATRWGPAALAAGLAISFVVTGFLIASFGARIGLNQESISQIAAYMMILFGLILAIRPFAEIFERAFAGLANHASSQSVGASMRGQFGGGLLLGAVWSPCIGPTLGAAIALASQGESQLRALLIMCAFALGVTTIIIGLSLGSRELIGHRSDLLSRIAPYTKPILGVVFILVGVMIVSKTHHRIEAWAGEVLPFWLQDLSVKF